LLAAGCCAHTFKLYTTAIFHQRLPGEISIRIFAENLAYMNDFKPYAVLEYVVNLIKNTISDAKIEYGSIGTATLKDGNDTLYLEQKFDLSGNFATIFINDPREIIYSEDLLSPLHTLHEGAQEGLKAALQTATIIVNDLDVETQLVFQTVKDGFDQLSNSYEFVKPTKKETTKVTGSFKFGKHIFILTVINESDRIFVTPEFAAGFDPSIRKTIEGDASKVQNAVHAIYKSEI
jgi:hypothetical protein